MGIKMFLNAADALFASLERETLSCINNLDSMPAEEIVRFCEKRQGIIDAIEEFNRSFKQHHDRLGGEGEDIFLEEFRERQTALLSRVIEADGLLAAFAEIGLKSLKADQALISRGRRALCGYREEGCKLRFSLKQMI
jgi:hypothetical protein